MKMTMKKHVIKKDQGRTMSRNQKQNSNNMMNQ